MVHQGINERQHRRTGKITGKKPSGNNKVKSPISAGSSPRKDYRGPLAHRQNFPNWSKWGFVILPQDLCLIPFAFSSVYDWLKWHGLHTNHAFVRFLDAQLLISAQTTTKNANALYGATALDLARQGVFHVEGGIGGIAETLIERLESLGGEIKYRQRATRIEVQNRRSSGVGKTWAQSQNRRFLSSRFRRRQHHTWNLNTLLGERSSGGIATRGTATSLGSGRIRPACGR